MSADPQPWGPASRGRGGGGHRRTVAIVGIVVLALVAGLLATGVALYAQAEGALNRVPVEGLTDPEEGDGDGDGRETVDSDARHFLVVGSDSREDVEHAEDVALGDKDGQSSDVIMYVSLTDERDELSVVSLPRDLVVERGGTEKRISDTFDEGADELVAAVQEEYGLPVHHYVQVTFDGFIDAVDTLGGIDICLEDDLVDPDAGADLEAGCQRLEAADALAFVRSREGTRADYERMERQHRFLRAAADELTQRRLLADVPRLFSLVEDVAGHVTTDEGLGLPQMLGLADELRDVVDGDVPMVSVPSYPDTLGPAQVMRIYEPGARAIFDDVRAGRSIPDRGTSEQRAETSVAIWSGGRAEELEIIGSVLHFAGFEDRWSAGHGPAELDAGSTTTVYAHADDKPAAERVAALLGAPLRELPDDIEAPADAEAIVAVGRDAAGATDSGLGDLPDRIETQADNDA